MATATLTPVSGQNYARVERLMAVVVEGWRAADDLTVAHEAWRLEGLPSSPLVEAMRAFLVAEQAIRAADKAIRAAQLREQS